jgi:hypothetical protein
MKTAAERKRKERELKKAAGLVRKEVWINPIYSDALKNVEKYLRSDKYKIYYYTSGCGMSIEKLG